MEIGIVGLPNVGKSTLFNALTGAGVAAQNFPFTTIEPNVGVVPLPDARLQFLAQLFESQLVTPAGVRFVDIAGLVKGASQGEGLGNQFLSHIRAVDAIAHVVRCFEDANVVNTLGSLNPLEAADIIDTELLLADLQQAQKAKDRLQGPARSGDKQAREKLAGIEKIIEAFDAGTSARQQAIPPDLQLEFGFLSGKPLLYVANSDETGPVKSLLDPLIERAQRQSAECVTLCAKLESEILQLPDAERQAYYEAAGIVSPGLAELAQAGKQLLGLISFFTAGPKETRAWLTPNGTKAPKAAGQIHSDIERGFIRAEIYKFADIQRLGSYRAVQEKGLVTMEGKEYGMKEGDVVYFRFNV